MFISFYSFSSLLFLSPQDHSKKAKPSTQNYSLLYNSQTRLHRQISKQNSKLDQTKLHSTRSRYNQKDRIKKNGKDRSVMVIRYRGTSPKLGSCQGECPYPCNQFLRGGDDGVIDDVGLSSVFQGIGSPSQKDD